MDENHPNILHPRARLGLELFNHGLFFEAHEELEAAWRITPGITGELYRGILQVAVAYYHLERDNFVGAFKMFKRYKRWLAPFDGTWLGIEIDRFKDDTSQMELLAENSAQAGKFIRPQNWPPKIWFM